MARASGCSLSASTAAASASSRSSPSPASTAATPVTAGWPLVSVPVLSNSTASTVRIRSSASRSLTRMPARAATLGGDRDHQRDGQPERVRAGDDQHGHRALDRLVRARRAAIQTTNVITPGGRGEVEQQRRGPVGQRLRAGPATPAPAATSRWMPASAVSLADRVDPDPQRGVGGDRAGHHPVPDRLRHRPRLAGDHRLVELGLARRR